MKNTVILIIDLQNDYFPDGKFPLFNIQSVSENSQEILLAARKHNIPVIHVWHEFLTKDAPFFIKGTEGVKINGKLKPEEGEAVINKNYPNAFRDTELKSLLDRHHYKHIIVVGAMSQMCVDATVRAGLDFGYQITVIQDAVASKEIEFNAINIPAETVQATMMWILSFAGASLMTTQEFLSRLS